MLKYCFLIFVYKFPVPFIQPVFCDHIISQFILFPLLELSSWNWGLILLNHGIYAPLILILIHLYGFIPKIFIDELTCMREAILCQKEGFTRSNFASLCLCRSFNRHGLHWFSSCNNGKYTTIWWLKADNSKNASLLRSGFIGFVSNPGSLRHCLCSLHHHNFPFGLQTVGGLWRTDIVKDVGVLY